MCWVSFNMPRRLPAPAPCLHDPRRAPLTVSEAQIGAGRHQRLQRGHMPPAAATEDDGLDDGGPVHVFDVVQRRVGGDQLRTTPSWPRCAPAMSAMPLHRLVKLRALAPNRRRTRNVASSSATAAMVTAP